MILVTGGAGFIGSNLVAGLENSGAGEIVVCDHLGIFDKWRNLSNRDVSNLIPPEQLLNYIDSEAQNLEKIFHMGAISSTTETDADKILKTNFWLTQEIWKKCARYRIPLIYASSAATYGSGQKGFDDNFTKKALSDLKPLNAYGWSKHLFDSWVARIIESGDEDLLPPQWAGLKFFNVFGPNEYHKEGQISVVLKLYKELMEGSPPTLFRSHNPAYKHGEQKRDFVWVGDCVKVMVWLFENTHVSGLFNLGTGKARSFSDVVSSLLTTLQKKAEIRFVDTPEALQTTYQYFTEAKIGRLRSAGYKSPFKSLEAGIKKYVENHLTKDDPYL